MRKLTIEAIVAMVMLVTFVAIGIVIEATTNDTVTYFSM